MEFTRPSLRSMSSKDIAWLLCFVASQLHRNNLLKEYILFENGGI